MAKAKKTMDSKLVAFKQDDKREVKYISKKYNVPYDVVFHVMQELGKDGKPSRSRAKIYAALRSMDYPIPFARKKKPNPAAKASTSKAPK